MSLEIIDPIDYPGWDELLLNSGNHSFFHTSAWARCLMESYGYKAVYFASFEDGHLSFLMPFMEISSPFTGKRGVSLPFADFCEPFRPTEGTFKDAVQAVIDFGRQAKWMYAEWRGAEIPENHIVSNECFFTHDLDLAKTESELFLKLKENNRRNIKRASRDGLEVEFGNGHDSLARFYRLNCITRRRHGLPPQPLSFFKNVLKYIISPGHGTFVTARYEERAIASSVFFHFGKVALFKYGASDPNYLSHRPNNFIIWEAMKWYKARGITILSLGRTDVDNLGLIRFKRAWNAVEKPLKYCRYDFGRGNDLRHKLRWDRGSKLFSSAPTIALRIIGRMLYKHLG